MPAEWEPHAATWIGWPHNASDWPDKLPAVQWAYGEIVRHLAPGETVRILVNSTEHEQDVCDRLTRVGVDLTCVEFFVIPTNRGWTRDFGPIFVRRDTTPGREQKTIADPQHLAIARFGFNAWAKYPDWQLDARVAEQLAERLGAPLFPIRHEGRDVVLEGGAIDVNGVGTLLTTEECLLDQQVQVRNPGLTREEMETVLCKSLGVRNVIWLSRGIVGDDTHGHVDDLCRFVNRNTVVLAEEPDADDPNHRILEENRERLESARLEDGSRLDVIRLPMPAPLAFDSVRLPASYANFYIANAAVLVPTFNDPHDRIALGILADLFRDRPVIGIHAVDLVWGLGTLHCLTQQEPQDE
ncbi:MAG: agmatine deiminase family protein [Planctomycetaceae bacterium]|nr:agmatine deiminase family protein [Planctomycetaceae bacterium]